MSTVMGSSTRGHNDDTDANTRFKFPQGIAAASDGTLYVADADNHRNTPFSYQEIPAIKISFLCEAQPQRIQHASSKKRNVPV